MAQPSFEAATYHELGTRRAHDPDALALAERLLAAALPTGVPGVAAQDEPYLRSTLLTAARIGAGIGLVDPSRAGCLDPGVAGALGAARRALPVMPPDRARLGAWLLACGHYLARHDEPRRQDALRALVEQL